MNPPGNLSDTEAMDSIHETLNGVMWDATTVEDVAYFVMRTGRVIHDPEEAL